MELRSEVLAIYRELLEAWNRRDPAAFAALFAESGSSVGFDGSQMNGRTEIEGSLRAIFADHQTASYVARVREIRPLGPGVSLLRAVAGMTPPGTRELNPATHAIQSVVIVVEAGQSRIALLHNTPAAFHGRPESRQQLTGELAEVLRMGVVVADVTDRGAPE